MLTKDDFKQLRVIIREEVETEGENIRSELGSDIRMSRMEIQNDVRELADRVKNVEIGLLRLQKAIKKLEDLLIKTIKLFDREYIALRKRVEKVEGQLSRN